MPTRINHGQRRQLVIRDAEPHLKPHRKRQAPGAIGGRPGSIKGRQFLASSLAPRRRRCGSCNRFRGGFCNDEETEIARSPE